MKGRWYQRKDLEVTKSFFFRFSSYVKQNLDVSSHIWDLQPNTCVVCLFFFFFDKKRVLFVLSQKSIY